VALPEPEGAPTAPRGPQPVRFAGSVAAPGGEGGDKTMLETPLGRLLLDQRLALPPGTALSLTRLAILPPAASPNLAMGMIVQAKVLSQTPGALPSGSALTLRIALAGAAASGGLTGTIAASGSSETLIETPLGTLSLDRRLALPAGTALDLQPLSAAPPDAPSELPLAQRAGWPALDQALSVLDRVAPDLAARLRTDLSPSSGQQLAGTLLFLMSALNTGGWPGARALSALDSAGRRDLRTKLEGDSAELRQLAEPKGGDGRLFVLPTRDGGVVNPVRLYLRRRAPGVATADQGTRFVLDVDMSRLGAVQLDGLVRNQRLDLVLRSRRAIAGEMRQGIAEVFHNAVAAAGLAGDITFTTASRFAVSPLDAVQSHIGVSA